MSETSDLIGATGHPAVPVTPDVSDPPSTEAARDPATDALGRADIAAIKSKHHPENLFHHNANIQPALLATDPLAAAREFYHGKLGPQIDRKNENATVRGSLVTRRRMRW